MTTPLSSTNIDHAIKLYLAGKPMTEITAATGITHSALQKVRARRGIPPRRVKALPVEDIAAAYVAGESEYSLSLRYKVSRNVIRLRLMEHGVQIRDMSSAGRVRASKMTSEQRAAQAAAAHDAARGSKRTYDELVQRAARNEQSGRFHSPSEARFAAWLAERGYQALPQKAIGKYNVDIAVAPVAVEILGGGWHAYKSAHAVRTPEILNAGWHLAFVWDHEGDSALTEHAADHVVSWLEEIRRNPPAIGQYRVISGGGQLLSAGSTEDDQFTLVPPPRGRSRLRA